MPHSKPKARLFVDAALGPGGGVGLDAGQAHYLERVMRLGPGDAVLVFNGCDGEWRAHLEDNGRKRRALAIERQTRPQAAEPGPWLAFAPLKKSPMDFVAIKATEPVALEALLAAWPGGRRLLVPDESGGGIPLAEALGGGLSGDHAFLIGPEGGWAPDELDALRKLPFVTAVGLGPRILRADTAALAALACWQGLVGDWHEPPQHPFDP